MWKNTWMDMKRCLEDRKRYSTQYNIKPNTPGSLSVFPKLENCEAKVEKKEIISKYIYLG